MNKQLQAIVRKDLGAIVQNRQMLAVMLVVPLVLSVLMPLAFVVTLRFLPDEMGELELLLNSFPAVAGQTTLQRILNLIINYMLPVLFLMIPIMAASVMSAGAFVGEKEKQTLETLLYSPLTLQQVFRAKVMAAFLLGLLVSAVSFVAMVIAVEGAALLLLKQWIPLGITWLAILLLVGPALSLIAITLMVRTSAKAQTAMEAQQRAGFLILPLVLLLVGQFTGVMLISFWVLLALGVAAAAVAFLLLRRALAGFTYERALAEQG